MYLVVRAQRCLLSEMLATLLALVWLLPSMDELVLLADSKLRESAIAVAARIVPGTLMHRAHMFIQVAGTVTHLGAEAAAVGALQCVIVEVNLQLSSCGLLHTTIGAGVVPYARMAHHVHL